MLTRSGVAKKLGRSIATVRRLEGRVLFPIVDGHGVHRFSDDEVRRLQLRVRAGDRIHAARGDWLLGRNPTRAGRQSTHDAAMATGDVIERERAAAQREVAGVIVELLDARQLRRLGPELTDYLESLLDDP